MSKLNPKDKSSTPPSHLNWMGGTSFDIKNPILRLRVAASSCFFGEPQYYHQEGKTKIQSKPVGSRPTLGGPLTPADLSRLHEQLESINPTDWRGKTPKELLTKAIDAALDFNPESTLAFAAELRQTLHIRTTPQVIMVRAARHPKVKGTDLIQKYAPAILHRMDEPATQMAYHLAEFGKPIPSVLKRAWARRLARAKPYELMKYQQKGHVVNLYDVVNVCHPASEAVSAFMKGEIKLEDTEKTWESIRAAGSSWEEAAKVMGHMALLRNLRNLEGAGVLTDKLLEDLVAGVEKGRQLPFRYYTAFRELRLAGARSKVLDAVESCLEKSFAHVPRFSGRVMSLVDNSGSARGAQLSSMSSVNVATVGNLMGVITARASDEGFVGVFGDRYEAIQMRQKSSVFDTVEQIDKVVADIGGGTEHGVWLFWDQAIRQKEHWDHVFVYSDMQAGHGGLYGVGDAYPKWGSYSPHGTRFIDVPELVRRYRKEVNPNVFVYLVQIAGYQDTLIPETYNRTFILGGWSDSILHYALEMTKLFQS